MVFVHNDCEYWISKRRGRGRDRDIYSSQFVWIAGCDFIAIESTDADDQEFVSRLTVGVEKRRAATIEEAPAKLLHGERKIQKAKLEEGNAKYSQAAASLGSRSHILNVVPSYEQVGELRVKQNTEQEERDAIVVRRQTALRVAEEEDARRAQQEKQDAITVDKQTAIKRGEEEKLKVQREERSAKKSRQVAKKRAKAEEYVKAQQDEHYREKMRVQTAWRDRKQANKQEKKERLKERLKEQKKERSKEQKKERSKEKTKEKTKENIVHGEAARHSLKLPRVWVSWLILFSSIAPYVVQILLWIPWNFLCISFVALSYYALLPFLLIVCLNILISPLLHVDSHVHSEVLCHLLWARIEFIGIEMLMLVMGLGYGALQAHEYYPGHQSLGDTQPIFCGY